MTIDLGTTPFLMLWIGSTIYVLQFLNKFLMVITTSTFPHAGFQRVFPDLCSALIVPQFNTVTSANNSSALTVSPANILFHKSMSILTNKSFPLGLYVLFCYLNGTSRSIKVDSILSIRFHAIYNPIPLVFNQSNITE